MSFVQFWPAALLASRLVVGWAAWFADSPGYIIFKVLEVEWFVKDFSQIYTFPTDAMGFHGLCGFPKILVDFQKFQMIWSELMRSRVGCLVVCGSCAGIWHWGQCPK